MPQRRSSVKQVHTEGYVFCMSQYRLFYSDYIVSEARAVRCADGPLVIYLFSLRSDFDIKNLLLFCTIFLSNFICF